MITKLVIKFEKVSSHPLTHSSNAQEGKSEGQSLELALSTDFPHVLQEPNHLGTSEADYAVLNPAAGAAEFEAISPRMGRSPSMSF